MISEKWTHLSLTVCVIAKARDTYLQELSLQKISKHIFHYRVNSDSEQGCDITKMLIGVEMTLVSYSRKNKLHYLNVSVS